MITFELKRIRKYKIQLSFLKITGFQGSISQYRQTKAENAVFFIQMMILSTSHQNNSHFYRSIIISTLQPLLQKTSKPTMSQDYRMKLSKQYQKKLAKQCVEVIANKRVNNANTYKILMQDQTIGDLMRIYLLKHKDVKFAGSRQVHPLDDYLEVVVQTHHQDTNKVVKDTLMNLQRDLFDLEITFDLAAKNKYHEID